MHDTRYNFGQVGCVNVVYDGVDLSDVFEVHDVHVPLLPAVEAVTQEMAGRPGAYFHSRKLKTREITMKLGLDAGSRCPVDIYHAWREHAALLAKGEPKKLYLNDDRYIWAMLTGETAIENTGYRGTVELAFSCFDPFFYGKEHTVALSSGSNSVEVLGGVAAYPVFAITASGSTVELTNTGTGEKVKVTGLSNGTALAIDMAGCRCTVNGNYKAADITVTDFWPIGPGTAGLSLSGGSGTMTYEERYL